MGVSDLGKAERESYHFISAFNLFIIFNLNMCQNEEGKAEK